MAFVVIKMKVTLMRGLISNAGVEYIMKENGNSQLVFGVLVLQ